MIISDFHGLTIVYFLFRQPIFNARAFYYKHVSVLPDIGCTIQSSVPQDRWRRYACHTLPTRKEIIFGFITLTKIWRYFLDITTTCQGFFSNIRSVAYDNFISMTRTTDIYMQELFYYKHISVLPDIGCTIQSSAPQDRWRRYACHTLPTRKEMIFGFKTLTKIAGIFYFAIL